jgi:hypothetical protein
MLKKALYASALLLPLGFLGTVPAVADVSVGVGFGSPYYGYGYYPYHRYYDYGLYDAYGPAYGYDPYFNDRFDDEAIDDDVQVVEPAAAPTGCVKTNISHYKNACAH